MKLTLISNTPAQIVAAQAAGVDRVMIDLEKETKIARQLGMNLHLSDHELGDLSSLSNLIRPGTLVVRINSIHPGSRNEIQAICEHSAVRYLMLPYFTTLNEVERFFEYLPAGVDSILLLESRESLMLAEDILSSFPVNEAFLGLNDLALSFHHAHLFQIFENDLFYRTLAALKSRGIPFGFGGVGNLLSEGLPIEPRLFLAFQVSQGATRGWLSRNFRSLFSEPDWHEALTANCSLINALCQKVRAYSEAEREKLICEFRGKAKTLAK
jgi:hypothetical protein